jgi:hypothetical protein
LVISWLFVTNCKIPYTKYTLLTWFGFELSHVADTSAPTKYVDEFPIIFFIYYVCIVVYVLLVWILQIIQYL